MSKKKKKAFLCKEGSETFWIEAYSLEEAEEHCIIWNAVVIRELTDEEIKKG